MTPSKVVAPVDLGSKRAEASIRRALRVAQALRADLTLLSITGRRWFEPGPAMAWPELAFGGTYDVCAIHRVVMPGPAEEAIPRYMDQIGADYLLLGKEHLSRRWFGKGSVATSMAAVTKRALLIVPDDETLMLDGPRVACVAGGPGHPVYRAANTVISRCGGQLRTWPAPFAPYQLVDAAVLEGINLMVALDTGDMLPLARRLPCALLLLKPVGAQTEPPPTHRANDSAWETTSAR